MSALRASIARCLVLEDALRHEALPLLHVWVLALAFGAGLPVLLPCLTLRAALEAAICIALAPRLTSASALRFASASTSSATSTSAATATAAASSSCLSDHGADAL
eukprot:1236403-Rhodomonas_salina.1